MMRKAFIVLVALAVLAGCAAKPAKWELSPLPPREPGRGERVVVFTEGACVNAAGRLTTVVVVAPEIAAEIAMSILFRQPMIKPLFIAPTWKAAATPKAVIENCYVGDLIAVDEKTLIVLRGPDKAALSAVAEEHSITTDPKLYEIRLAQIARVEVPVFFYVTFREFSQENLARMRAYAAYPRGLSPEQRRELLARHGQKDFLKVMDGAPADEKPE